MYLPHVILNAREGSSSLYKANMQVVEDSPSGRNDMRGYVGCILEIIQPPRAP